MCPRNGRIHLSNAIVYIYSFLSLLPDFDTYIPKCGADNYFEYQVLANIFSTNSHAPINSVTKIAEEQLSPLLTSINFNSSMDK